MLDRIDEISAAAVDFDERAVRLAAWFHDGVYDGQPCAEERSAQWAERALLAAGLPAETVAEVARLVRLTETHRPGRRRRRRVRPLRRRPRDPGRRPTTGTPSTSPPSAASTPTSPTTPSARAGPRSSATCSTKPHLFHTAYAREHWEDAARANVQRELGR